MHFKLKYTFFLILTLLSNCNNNDVSIDWRPTFESTDKIPYGTFVLRQELANIFPNNSIKTIRENTQTFFKESHSEYIECNYMFIYKSYFHDQDTWEEILAFVNHSGKAFVSGHYFNTLLKRKLELQIDSLLQSSNQEKVKFSVINPIKGEEVYEFSDRVKTKYFSKFNPKKTEILGYIYYDGKKEPNFIKVYYGTGYFLLHAEPYTFTNYHMLKNTHYKYAVNCFSYIDDAMILWDNHKFKNRQFKKNKKGGFFNGLQYILKQQSLRLALYLLIILGFLYLIFNSKRIQQAIPIIKPYKNYNLSFAKTIAILYQNHNDHTALSNYKINYFIDQVRKKYHISNFEINNSFAKTLSIKSGTSIILCQQIEQEVLKAKNKKKFNKKDFNNLHQLLQTFNLKSKIYGK